MIGTVGKKKQPSFTSVCNQLALRLASRIENRVRTVLLVSRRGARDRLRKIGINNGFDPNEYTRLPKPGSEGRIFGLARTTLFEIGERCPGLLLKLKQKDAKRGVTLLHVPTLRAYLQRLREGAEV